MAQDGPKRGPREAQDGPKSAQERPKRGPRGDFSGPEGAIEIGTALFFDRWPPRWPKRGPRGAPEGPKTAPRAPKRAPRAPQEGPKRGPRGSQRPPTCPQEGPMMAPRGLQDAPSSRYLLHFARVAVLGWAGGDSRSVNNYSFPPREGPKTPTRLPVCTELVGIREA